MSVLILKGFSTFIDNGVSLRHVGFTFGASPPTEGIGDCKGDVYTDDIPAPAAIPAINTPGWKCKEVTQGKL